MSNFFSGLSDLVLGSNSDIKDLAGQADLNLGNIFLPGGLKGGASNTETPGTFGGTPMNESDWRWLNQNWNTLRSNSNFNPDAAQNWQDSPELVNGLSAGGQQFVKDNWSDIGRAAQFGDINWNASGKVGRDKLLQTYAPPPGAGGAPTGPDTTSNIGMFNQVAADQLGQVGQNSSGNILELLRAQANPFERKAFQGINQNLFSRGRLGANDSATGEAYQGFSRGLAEADTQRQVAAMGLGDQLQTSALQRALGATQGAGALTTLSTLPFDMALKLAIAKSGAAVNQGNLMKAGQGDSLLDAWGKFWSFGG